MRGAPHPGFTVYTGGKWRTGIFYGDLHPGLCCSRNPGGHPGIPGTGSCTAPAALVWIFMRSGRIMVAVWKPDRDFVFENGDRFSRKNRWSIWKKNSGIDFILKNGIRFLEKNRGSILRSTCGFWFVTVFWSMSDFIFENGDRFWDQNRWSISVRKSDRDFSGMIFDRDHDRDWKILIGM